MGNLPHVAAEGTASQTYPESRVLLIITGGTICMRPSAGGLVPVDGFLKNAMAPRPSFNDLSESVLLSAVQDGKSVTLPSLRTPPSSYARHIRYAAIEFSPLLDSSSISSEGWTSIASAIRANYHLYDGFVVLHGTDSLAYSASALSFMLSDLGKPVILTGSQASIFALQSDAVDNLLGSLIIAGTFVIPEVCLFFHHKLYRGNRCTKVSASAFEAFASPNCDPLARVTSLGVDVNWGLVLRPTTIARFDVTPHLDTAHVAALRIFPGIKPEMVDGVLRVPHLRGLVLETFGMGNAPAGVDGSLTRVIRNAVERGIVVVNVSQCTSGFVSPLYAPGFALGEAGVVFGHDLTSEAALTKLSYLFALPGLTAAEVGRRMSRSLRGEMTALASPSFTHPQGFADAADLIDHASSMGPGTSTPRPLSRGETTFAELGYAIQAGDLRTVAELLDTDALHSGSNSVGLLQRADYAGNTAVHLAAVGPEAAVLRELLVRGASVHVRNRANNTPLFLAEKMGNRGCVDLLVEAGAALWVEEKIEEGAKAA
ncbi:L-asparaginase [Xylaria bambusicola]|uniref:L-asparaginase n=1 Tax=Xylaria bambusicola TaxID=326684 RepID=UPI00200723B1|nr:L-asparaginase [Xylaria bambusicola]KAI0515416.1 L-asparaginase [Xylaria bambusicola]